MQCVRHSRIVFNPHAFLTNLERHHFVHHERNVLVAFVHFVVFPHCVYKERFQHILLFHLYGVDGVHQIGVVHHYLRRLFGEFLSFRVHHVDKSCICQILDVIHHRGSGCLYVVGQLAYVGRFRSVHGQQI